ncbi:DUF3014 domain-containing protein [Pseudoalteromonas fenneropenaei]|uniref:DUF3014 domain-containing protein n=1 Tax=Pseudoalteromonas fenneropenaei TaxID=1737459 RepID=A0ABV7CMZ0_9GAMM
MSQHQSNSNAANAKKTQLFFAAMVLVVLAVVIAYVLSKQSEPVVNQSAVLEDVVNKVTEPVAEPTEPSLPTTNEPTPTLPEPTPSEPLPQREPEAPVKPPLPTLDNSDTTILAEVKQRLTEQAIKLVAVDDVIRRTVVFVDNLAKGDVAKKHSPVVEPLGKFTALDGDIVIIDPNSYERYTPYVNMLTGMSGAQLVRLYEEYEPLFITAYEEIGYEGDKFRPTLNEAIKELLDTPIPKTPVPLIKDSVTYKYAYPEWEQLSAAQKQFLRMGPENMTKLKTTLKAMQQALEQ